MECCYFHRRFASFKHQTFLSLSEDKKKKKAFQEISFPVEHLAIDLDGKQLPQPRLSGGTPALSEAASVALLAAGITDQALPQRGRAFVCTLSARVTLSLL